MTLAPPGPPALVPPGPDAAAPLPSFDVCGPLPTGTTVLEASAGTGKTHTVGALVTRFVAEGVATLDELLVVTFGRNASMELRERVREQLVAAERALADPAGTRARGDRDVLGRLAGADGAGADEVAERHRRLVRALADFEAATIATTHQFCQQVLTGLGVAGDSEAEATLVENLDDLVQEVADDLYLRKFGMPSAQAPEFDRERAQWIARCAVADPQARLEPADAPPQSPAATLQRFASAVRLELEQRKRRLGVLGYDDLLTRVAVALQDDGAPARDRMRSRWRVVLVDEFQDTDPVQWDVLRLAFHGHATIVLIGDPKQAIYAFRGGDVTTYLAAARVADHRATLGENWRADPPLVQALQVLFDGAALGHPDIVVRPVVPGRSGTRLDGAPCPAPLRLRVLGRPAGGRGGRFTPIDKVRGRIADDLAQDVAALLASGATFDGRPLTAGDVAVLVGTHGQADHVRTALDRAGVPSVIAAAGSIYLTPAAEDWLVVLEALEQPHRSGRARAAALTPFLGLTAADLDRGGDRLTDLLGEKFRRWADLVTARGVATLLELADAEEGMPARVLAHAGGERQITDLRQLGQELQAAAMREGLGLAALVEWLREQTDRAQREQQAADRLRRLESEAAAVQVLTVHTSKGLQFPVVYLPFAFDRHVKDDLDPLTLHDADGHRVLDVGGPGSAGRAERQARAQSELAGEALRLTYVALTRAQSQVVTWWAPSNNTPGSGLHRLLFGRRPGHPIPDVLAVPNETEVGRVLGDLAARGGPVVERVADRPDEPADTVTLHLAHAPDLSVGRWARTLDTAWRRSSYSALSAAAQADAAVVARPVATGPAAPADRTDGVVAARDPGVTSEPETGERDDEDLDVDLLDTDGERGPAGDGADEALRAVPSPMAQLPTGATFGTLVHAVFEHVDPRAADLSAELLARCREQLARRAVPVSATDLAAALEPVLRTPLGPLADGRALADIAVRDRLAELEFELPLAGGDRPSADVALGDLAPLLPRHLPDGDPLVGYAERLASPEMAGLSLRGYLTGSLDAVLRLPGPRYLVADYKTNWLAGPDEPLTAWHYRPVALRSAMTHSDYPLQALFYCVALHRFLRWRQPGYHPERHLGGVLYLYVRGMAGPDVLAGGDPAAGDDPVAGGGASQGPGVFGWRPPPALVLAVSDVLDGAR
ncbi:UvrD-helicase domain-containing protein [Nakamurella endophytica]|uniref:RecBCD enzyme subunit RecB n=1 Tax=Nakamurella endophytica TaxID=1748367 RepID=A0A917SVL1_9ACTN|nr:UvrD-helicase domain-containing protein [Nakamurella endophytica]GGL99803.1 RecBCD enzyme subunit RecB [Nakamurella endophytica]